MFGEQKRKVSATTLRHYNKYHCVSISRLTTHQKIQITWDIKACNDGSIKPISNYSKQDDHVCLRHEKRSCQLER